MEIYLIENTQTGKMYVGMTTRGYMLRFSEHIRQSRTDKYVIGLHGAMKKYGEDSFSVRLICEADSMDELISKEIYYIDHFNTMTPNGYNLKSGGYDGFYSEYVRKRISKANKGRKHSKEARKKMSAAQKGRPKTVSQIEAARKRSIGNTYALGHKQTDDHKRKISEGNKGKVRSDDVKKLLSEMNKGNKHPQSDSNIYTFHHNEYGKFVGTRSDFYEAYGFRLSHLFGKNKRKTYKGWNISDA